MATSSLNMEAGNAARLNIARRQGPGQQQMNPDSPRRQNSSLASKLPGATALSVLQSISNKNQGASVAGQVAKTIIKSTAKKAAWWVASTLFWLIAPYLPIIIAGVLVIVIILSQVGACSTLHKATGGSVGEWLTNLDRAVWGESNYYYQLEKATTESAKLCIELGL